MFHEHYTSDPVPAEIIGWYPEQVTIIPDPWEKPLLAPCQSCGLLYPLDDLSPRDDQMICKHCE